LAGPLLRLLLILAALAAPVPAAALVLRSVDWTITDVGAEPGPNTQWQTYDLPLRWTARPGEPLRGVAMRLNVRLDAPPAQAWAVLLSHAPTGGRISVNGRMVGELQSSDAGTEVRWRRPHLLAIDPALLVAGDNTIDIRSTYRSGTHVLAGVEIGPLAEIGRAYERQHFASSTLPWIGATLAASLALGVAAAAQTPPAKPAAANAAAVKPAAAAVPAACRLKIAGNDLMQFDRKELRVSSTCREVEVVLKHTGKLPVAAMGHNWVLTRTPDA